MPVARGDRGAAEGPPGGPGPTGAGGGGGPVKRIGIGFQQRSVTGSKARKENRILSIFDGFATFK